MKKMYNKNEKKEKNVEAIIIKPFFAPKYFLWVKVCPLNGLTFSFGLLGLFNSAFLSLGFPGGHVEFYLRIFPQLVFNIN
jgi:hypothetical protein